MRATLAQGESLFTFGPADGHALIMARYCQALALGNGPVPETAYIPSPSRLLTPVAPSTPPAPTDTRASHLPSRPTR